MTRWMISGRSPRVAMLEAVEWRMSWKRKPRRASCAPPLRERPSAHRVVDGDRPLGVSLRREVQAVGGEQFALALRARERNDVVEARSGSFGLLTRHARVLIDEARDARRIAEARG